MALEAAAFPQDILSYCFKDLYPLAELTYDFRGVDHEQESLLGERKMVDHVHNNQEMGFGFDALCVHNWESSSSSMAQNHKDWEVNSSPETCATGSVFCCSFPAVPAPAGAPGKKKKRRRTKSCKNKEEVESQRMAHIAVERNRRKQMNDYLAVLRSLMPPSYVQRGDQASIIGGAINFVKELEQHLQSLEAQKRIDQQPESSSFSSPFADFFTFPQYSSSNSTCPSEAALAENRSAVADIEVTMVESHASLKVLSKKQPKQLLKMVSGLQSLRLTVLHLNVTTVDQMVFYSFSLKVEDDCRLSSVDEIATSVHQMIAGIVEDQGEAPLGQAKFQ